ncbi:MAG TPA: hypothetical protein VKS01_07085 [Bryobacteraceae bacterium]|nr:hypothetical protein [Bryobacteraceae bacterium]
MRIAIALFVLLMVGAALAQAPSNYQPVGTMTQLMVDIIYPQSDGLFYIERNPPKNDHDWGIIRGYALTVAESGNLLMMDGRARDQGEWIKDSKLMIDAAAAAYKAAQNKDMQGILDLSERLSNSCIACHLKYRPGYGKR